MRVKLLKDLMVNGKVRVDVRPNKAWTPPKVVDGKSVTCGLPRYNVIAYQEGAEVVCSEATGERWIAEGLAEKIEPSANEPVQA